MTLTFQNIKYDITIDKRTDSVYIEFYDKLLYKTFSNTFLDTDIITFNMSIKTFYTVMNTVIKDYIKLDDGDEDNYEDENDEYDKTNNENNEDNKKSILKIIISNKQMKLDIHHKYYIEFKFEIDLKLNIDNCLDDKFKCLKKFEDKIKKLEISNKELSDQLDKINNINNVVSICIASWLHNNNNYNILIPYESPRIIIKNDNSLGPDICKISDEYIELSNHNNCTGITIKFNKTFQGVKCETLELISNYIFKDWDNNHLPLSVTKLTIQGYSIMYNFHLPNLINLELIDCSLEFIYKDILHLKTLKNITIQRCNNFKERELLISKNYNVKMLA